MSGEVVSNESDVGRDGDKKVQLGPKTVEVPEDWRVSRLSEVANINMGSSPSSEHYNEDGLGLPFYQGNADFGFRSPTTETWCSEPQKTAGKGEILISVRAPVGDLNISKEKCCIGRGLAALEGKEIDNEFLYYVLAEEQQRLQSYAQGSTFQAVNKSVLDAFPIAHPSLAEQRRIADIISTTEDKIRQTHDTILKTKQLKQGFLQDFYLSPEHGKTSTEEPTRVPDKWQKNRIEDVCSIGGGSTPRKSNEDYWNGETPWVTAKEFDEEGVINDTQDHVTEKGVNEASLTIYPANSTIVTVRSNVIKRRLPIAKITTPATVNQDMKALVPDTDQVDPEYFFQILKYNAERIRQTCRKSGTTIDSIDTTFLRKYQIMVPVLDEQERLANVLRQFDRKINEEKERKQHLKELKRGLMQDLLIGKVRVDPEKADT